MARNSEDIVLYISLKESLKQQSTRLICMETNLEYKVVQSFATLDEERKKYINEAKMPQNLILHDDNDRINLQVFTYKPCLVIIDDIQSLMLNNLSWVNDFEKISVCIKKIKEISRTFQIPIIAISQTNRNNYQLSGQSSLTSLKYSSQIIDEADLILMLSEITDFRTQNGEISIIKKHSIDIKKNQFGDNSNFTIIFQKPYFKFLNDDN